jgi:hypothetical protein
MLWGTEVSPGSHEYAKKDRVCYARILREKGVRIDNSGGGRKVLEVQTRTKIKCNSWSHVVLEQRDQGN